MTSFRLEKEGEREITHIVNWWIINDNWCNVIFSSVVSVIFSLDRLALVKPYFQCHLVKPIMVRSPCVTQHHNCWFILMSCIKEQINNCLVRITICASFVSDQIFVPLTQSNYMTKYNYICTTTHRRGSQNIGNLPKLLTNAWYLL